MIAKKTKLRRCGLIGVLPDSASGRAVICAVMPAFPSGTFPPGGGDLVPALSCRRRPRDTLSRVELLTELVHQLQLRLQVVDVVLFVGHYPLEQVGASRVL